MTAFSRIMVVAGAAALALAGCKSETPPPVPAEPPPSAAVLSFTASATEVDPGDCVTLSWQVEQATQVGIATVAGTPVALPSNTAQEGQVEVCIPETMIFILTAHGEGGKDTAALSVVTRSASPTMLFAAVPPQVTAGESAALIWNVPGAAEVIVSSAGNELHRSPNATGTFTVSPGFTSSYTLTAGDRTAEVEVAVLPAIIAFTASSASVMPGGEITLNWQVGGATSVKLEAEGRGELTTVTTQAEIADGSFQDVVPATLPLSGVMKYTLLADLSGTSYSKSVTVFVGADPRFLKVSVPEFAKEGGTYGISWETALADRLEVSVGGEVIYAALTPAKLGQGSLTLNTPAASTEIELRASNAVGGLTVEKRTVHPVGEPVFNSFTASPAVLAQGGSPVTLSWDVTNARTVRIAEKTGRLIRVVKGLSAEVASIETYPNQDTVYVLSGDNQVGDRFGPHTVSVKVQNPARLDFSPEPVLPSETSQLSGHSITNGGDIIGFPTAEMNVEGDEFIDISKTGNELIPQNGYYDYYYSVIGFIPETFSMLLGGQPTSTNSVTVNVNGGFLFDKTSYQYHYWYPEKVTSTSGCPAPPASCASALTPSTSIYSTLRGGYYSYFDSLAVTPWYDDLYYVAGTSKMHYRLDTLGADQRLIVQWTDMEHDDIPGSRMTFQAQLYSSGHVVFAYAKLDGVPSGTINPAVGVTHFNSTGFLAAPARPVAGDTIHFFGPPTLPLTVTASLAPYKANVMMGTEGDYISVDANPDMYRPGDFHIAEVNYNPDPTTAPNGEWIEIVNSTSRAVPLDGWTINFGTVPYTIPAGTNLTLPANGVLLIAESSDPLVNGGITPDHVPPTGSWAALSNTSGNVTLLRNGIQHNRAAWTTTSGGGLGISVVLDPNFPADHLPSGQNPACAGTGTYGAQTGSPGVKQQWCFPYRMERLPKGDFEQLAFTGTKLNGPSQLNAFMVYATGGGGLTPPLKWGRKTYDLISVSDNGYIALRDSAVETSLTCGTNSTCYNTNKTSPSTTAPTRLIAPYWDNVRSDTNSDSGIYIVRRDPDGTAASGDEYTIISWEGWHSEYSTSYTMNFQVKFFDTGDIEYHYGNNYGQYYSVGYQATSWLESEDGRYALRHNVNSLNPGTYPNTAVRFRYIP